MSVYIQPRWKMPRFGRTDCVAVSAKLKNKHAHDTTIWLLGT